MSDHDPLCPMFKYPGQICECFFIGKARADERERWHALLPSINEAVRADERLKIAQDVSALRHLIDEASIGWQLPRDVVRALNAAVDRIALRAGSADG